MYFWKRLIAYSSVTIMGLLSSIGVTFAYSHIFRIQDLNQDTKNDQSQLYLKPIVNAYDLISVHNSKGTKLYANN